MSNLFIVYPLGPKYKSYEDGLKMLNLFKLSKMTRGGDLIGNPFNEFESLKVN